MMVMTLGPAEDISFRFELHFSRPGVLAMFTKEFSLEKSQRSENSGNAAPGEAAAELRKFNPGRTALRTADSVTQDSLGSIPFVEQALRAGIIFFIDPKPNARERAGEEEKPLQIAFVENICLDSRLLQPVFERLGEFRLVESCNRHGFHKHL